MMLVFVVIFFASTAYRPAATQWSASAVANAYSYYYYPPYYGGWDCTYDRCTPTCSIANPRDCPSDSNPCNCPPGTIISELGGQCVQEQQCPRYINCNGDYNAQYTECPVRCPTTCAQPYAQNCGGGCGTPGCECKPGYILSGINGVCIKPEQCPAPLCGRNETFISCLVECPSLYCPVSPARVACGPSLPCSSSCGCKAGYLRRNVRDYTCILASDCPPGKCSGPNEMWNTCVGLCYSDKCKDRNKVPVPGDCPFSPSECYPNCICKKGYYRNTSGKCVPAEQCPA